jgi:hypothetical protein
MSIIRKLSRTLCGRHGLFGLFVVLFVYSFLLHNQDKQTNLNLHQRPIFKNICKPLHSRSSPINKKVLLIGEDGHICDNIRVFLESTRIPYFHLKNQPDNDLPILYDKNLIPNFTSFIFCSFSTYNKISESVLDKINKYSIKENIGQIIIAKENDQNLNLKKIKTKNFDFPDHHEEQKV